MTKVKNLSTEKKMKKNRNWKIITKNQAVDFCLMTGLHGYKYIVQDKRTKNDRLFWGTTVALSLCCSAAFLQMGWEYNSSHSTLTTISTMHYGIWNYPFPAVTFCNNNQISARKARDFVENLKVDRNISREFIFDQMKFLIEMLDPGIFEKDISTNLSILQDILNANKYSVSAVMNMIKPDCSSLLRNCKWKGSYVPCHEIFDESYARDGICCSFNSLVSKKKNRTKTKPVRLNACGHQTGLTVVVDAEPEDYLVSLYGSFGVKVILHYSSDYPDRSSEYKLVGLGVQAFLAVAPIEIYSTPKVKDLPLSTRQCLFRDEKLPTALASLTNFNSKNYSYVNCLNQCRANIILSNCGCFPYYNPQNGSRECNLMDIKCLKKIKFLYDTSCPGVSTFDNYQFNPDQWKAPCGCLFDCLVHHYPLDSSEAILDTERLYQDKQIIKTKEITNFSIISVFYLDFVSTQYSRDVYFNWKYVFASSGGLLGLFVGFSIMSAVEIVYFFVIRIFIDLYKKRTKSFQ